LLEAGAFRGLIRYADRHIRRLAESEFESLSDGSISSDSSVFKFIEFANKSRSLSNPMQEKIEKLENIANYISMEKVFHLAITDGIDAIQKIVNEVDKDYPLLAYCGNRFPLQKEIVNYINGQDSLKGKNKNEKDD